MPGDSEGLWYSFNMGPIHFIAIETEAYYFMNYGIKQMIKQYEWLDKDLQEANKPEARYVNNSTIKMIKMDRKFVITGLADHG